MKIVKFAKTAIKDYRRVGAIVPSSRYVAKRIGKTSSGKKIVVEYGAGSGVISKEMLKEMSADSKIFAFELNKEFFRELTEIADSRLIAFNEDVKKAKEMLKEDVDMVVSGVPFSLMKKEERDEIIASTASLLNPEGVFLLYQTSLIVLPLLKKQFKEVKIKFEPRNFPPYFIMIAKK